MRLSIDIHRIYRTAAAVGFPVLLVMAAADQSGIQDPEFEEITVQRINVVEPDGALSRAYAPLRESYAALPEALAALRSREQQAMEEPGQ